MTLLEAVVAGAAGFALAGVVSVYLTAALAGRSQLVMAVVAAAFGVAAAFAPGEPTRLSVLDVILRAAVGVACVYAGRYAPPPAVVASALLVALFSNGSSLQGLAFSAAGAIAAIVLVGRAAPLGQAIVSGAVALVALHLQWPRASLATSLVGVIALAPILITGSLGLPRPARRPVRRALVAVAVATAVLAGAGLVAALLAKSHLQHGVDAARQALAAVRAGDREQAAARFREASAAFDDARTTVGSVWAAPALAVPVVSPQLRAMRVVANSGHDLGRVGAETADAADISRLQVADGAVPVDALAALQPPLQRAQTSLARADTAISGVRSPWLVAPIRRRLSVFLPKIQRARTDADVAAEAASVVPAFLGTNGPRRYFLAMQNPAESRAVGGVIGNFGEIEADHGKLKLSKLGRVLDLNTQGVPPDQRKLTADSDYTARYAIQTPQKTWENVTMSPDFPSVAGVIGTLYPQSGGRPVDGVISINPGGLAALLRVVGPVNVPGWPSQVTADNAEEILENEQYTAFPDKSRRLEFLSTATDTIWKRLTATKLPSARELVSDLGPAVRHKDIIFSSFHAEEQHLFDRAGASARMEPVQGDYLGVVTQDATGGKLDWFTRRRIDYRVSIDPKSGQLNATLQIVLRNKAPSSGLPPYVVNGDNPLTAPAGDQRLYLSVYTPWTFTKATINGAPLGLQSERELGRTVLSDYLDVLPGAEVTIQIELAGRLSSGRDYRLDVYHQPTIASDQVTAALTEKRGSRLVPTWERHFDSTADSTFRASFSGGT